MNAETLDHLQTAASAEMFTDVKENRTRAAKKAIAKELLRMTAAEEIKILSDEEERMIRSLRRFKATCKAGAVFKWQTRPVEGIVITPANAPLMVHDPQEVA
jgi:hypothetical protein